MWERGNLKATVEGRRRIDAFVLTRKRLALILGYKFMEEKNWQSIVELEFHCQNSSRRRYFVIKASATPDIELDIVDISYECFEKVSSCFVKLRLFVESTSKGFELTVSIREQKSSRVISC